MDANTVFNRESMEEDICNIINKLKVGVYSFDLDGNTLYANIHFQTMFGYTEEEFKTKRVLDLFDVQDIYLIKEGIKKPSEEEISNSVLSIRGRRKDNSIIFLQLLIHKKIQDSQIIVVQFLDISDQFCKDANISSITYESPLAHIVVDINSYVKEWNLAAEKMFGWKMEEVINQPYPLMPNGEKLNLDDKNRYERNQSSLTGMEGKRVRKDQTFIDCIIYTIPLYNEKKIMNGVMLIIEDITQKKLQDVQLNNTYKELQDFKYALDQSATVSITDANGDILYVNDKFCEISKYSREELIGQNLRIVKSGYHPKEVFEDLWSTITKGQIWKGEVCNKAKDGTIWWGGATIVPFLDAQGKPYQYVGIRADITDKKLMEERVQKINEEIQLSERKFRSLVQHTNDIISILDEEGIVKYISPNFEKITGMNEGEVLENYISNFIHIDDIAEYRTVFDRVLGSLEMPIKTELRLLVSDGNYFNCEVVLTNLLHEPAVKGVAVNVRNITDNKIAENKIYQMSYYDFLTKLPNRRLFELRIEQECKQAKSKNGNFTLMLLDLKGLKFVNDSLGTEFGDQLLQEAVQRLKRYVDRKGVLYRLEGNEFTIIYPKIFDHQKINELSQMILDLFELPFFINGYELFLTTSVGVCIFPESGDSPHDLMKNAYSAVSEAKEKGMNQYQIFSPNMNIRSYKRFILKNDIRKAVINNEFYLDYQPRIDTKTNKIISAEALIRWEHPKWGIVSPKEFIQIAEEGGLIGTLGEMVLQQACLQNKSWQDAGLSPIIISVNFSVIQFLQTDMLQIVKRILKTTGLHPKWLEIEITESALMKDEAIVLAKIEQLKAMGINIAIDDFGTGYASLSYLKKLKANTLKIDRSFIKGIPHEPDSSEIVSSIIHLAQRLRIRTVAEGVETVEQLSLLKKIHCDEIQGYLYSKPITSQEFESLLREKICLPNQLNKVLNLQPDNRRKYFRIDLVYPLGAYMSISEFGGKKVQLGSTKILILDIGPGGIRIETNIKLPVRPDLILEFSTKVFGENVELFGMVVWSREVDDDLYSYGINFIIDEKARSHLTYLLNKLQVKLRNKHVLPDCSFVTESKENHFRAR